MNLWIKLTLPILGKDMDWMRKSGANYETCSFFCNQRKTKSAGVRRW